MVDSEDEELIENGVENMDAGKKKKNDSEKKKKKEEEQKEKEINIHKKQIVFYKDETNIICTSCRERYIV